MAATSLVLMKTFPNKALADEGQTLKEATSLNAVTAQRLTSPPAWPAGSLGALLCPCCRRLPEPRKPHEKISLPIHPPLIIKINSEEEEEEEEEEEDEENAISSSKSLTSTAEKELEKPLESGSELQEGDGLTVPTKYSLCEKQGEMKASFSGKPRTALAAFENGEVQAPNPQNKMSYHCNNTNRNASKIRAQRDAIRRFQSNAHPHSRPTNRSYNKVNVNKEPKLNLCPGDGLTVPTKYSLCEKQGEMKASFSGKPRTALAAFENGEVQAPNPQNKMSYHCNNTNRNASKIRAQRDAIRRFQSNAHPHSRPTNRSYNKVNVNKEPKLNLCPDKYGLVPTDRASEMRFPGREAQSDCALPLAVLYAPGRCGGPGKSLRGEIVKHELQKDLREGDVTSEHETCTIHVWHKKGDVTRDELTKLLFSFNLEVTEEGTEKQQETRYSVGPLIQDSLPACLLPPPAMPGLTIEDLNLTENSSQENKIGERKIDFVNLKNGNAAQSKLNSMALLWQRQMRSSDKIELRHKRPSFSIAQSYQSEPEESVTVGSLSAMLPDAQYSVDSDVDPFTRHSSSVQNEVIAQDLLIKEAQSRNAEIELEHQRSQAEQVVRRRPSEELIVVVRVDFKQQMANLSWNPESIALIPIKGPC
ncbi:hypothetical protein MC885_011465 [Smutsia gigantea]|nr:hypothetical protein MC885_011465 [Smutsia gigantea]